MAPTICQVLHSLNLGGAEVLAYRLAERLGGCYRFVFACLDDVGLMGDKLQVIGVPVEFVSRRPGLDLGCARRLANFIHRERVDVIHAHQYTPFVYSALSGLVGRRPAILFNEHGRFHPDVRSRKRVLFNRLMLRRRDRVVAVGRSVRQALVDNEGIPAARIRVIYNGVDLPTYTPQSATRASVRHELQLANEHFVILQVARLDAIKDHGTAIRTVERCVAEEPQLRLLIVGDGPERGRIQNEVSGRGLESYVRLLGQRTDVGRLLAAADLFLLTSVSEGIPVTLIEAMGARLPIVATSVGGVAEVVEHGRTGLLANAGADDELARAVLRVVKEPDLRRNMGQAGRLRAEAMFTEQQMHAAYASLYEEMARARY